MLNLPLPEWGWMLAAFLGVFGVAFSAGMLVGFWIEQTRGQDLERAARISAAYWESQRQTRLSKALRLDQCNKRGDNVATGEGNSRK